MRKYLIILITFFAINLSFSQNELYIKGNDGTNPTLYVKGHSGTTPTLFVDGEIVNSNGDFKNDDGIIEVKGDFTNTVGAGASKYESTGIERFSGTSNQTISGTLNGTADGTLNGTTSAINQLYNVELDNNTTITLGSDVNNHKNGTTKFVGNTVLVTSGNTYYIRNADPTKFSGYGTSGDLSKFILGNLKRETSSGNAYELPVGYSSTNTAATGEGLQMATVTVTTASSNGAIEARFDNGSPSTVPIIICPGAPTLNATNVDVILDNGYWTIANSGANITEFEMTLDPADFTSLGSPTNLDYTIIQNGSGTGQDDCTGTLSAIPITHTGLTSFSKWEIGASNDGSPLPVQLIYLQANNIENRYIEVSWSTATEINNELFEVQRSLDGENFTKIGIVAGSGNTSAIKEYNFNDTKTKRNVVYYYRLKQIDFDGIFEYTYKVSASLDKINAEISVSPFIPNPSSANTHLEIIVNQDTEARIVMFNGIGQVIIKQVFNLNKGANILPFNLTNMSSGIYHTTIVIGDESFSRKINLSK